MPIERHCIQKGCLGGANCSSKYRMEGESCVYEYVAADYEPGYRWLGEGPPPRRWTAINGTVVYRTFADYCD